MAKSNKNLIIDRIKAASTLEHTDTLDKSEFFNERDVVTTPYYGINVALSGKLRGGLTAGVTMIAGASKNFKTGILLLLMKAYLDTHKDAVALFYISEFGSPKEYFDSFGIDGSRVVVCPVKDVEQLKMDLSRQLEEMSIGDKIFIGVDSIGNLASRKEINDALNEKDVADMTRAKALKSLFRIVTPNLTLKDVPLVVINHTYKTLELYAKDVVGGGTGSYYSSDNIIVVSRKQDSDGKGEDKVLHGYLFKLRIEKSRYVKEKSEITLNVSFDDGISQYSGLLDIALESGHVIKEKDGNKIVYLRGDDGNAFKEEETETGVFWKPILSDPTFAEHIEKRFRLGSHGNILQEDTEEEDKTT